MAKTSSSVPGDQTPTTGTTLPGRAKGLHLADKGREQAEAAAERIAPFKGKVAAVYASPLERTREGEGRAEGPERSQGRAQAQSVDLVRARRRERAPCC